LQQHFDLIPHPVQGGVIYQRPKDGYINATAMCQAAEREFKHYNENRGTKDFVSALSSEVGIPTSDLVQSMKGGDIRFQGTWVHPQVAIHLAQWLSPKFAVQVTQWVYDWMSGKSPATVADTVPYHLRRYVANQPNIPVAHFSILSEMTTLLIAPMEIMGYTLPEHMLPDISNGKMFCKWLRDVHGI
jgi:KilA-N domain